MSEEQLRIFIDCIVRYFDHASDVAVKIGTPYLEENQATRAMDYSGVIAISGNHRGSVCFTAPKILLKHLLLSIGENDTSEANLADMIGEVSNTLSGNARKELGKNFVISTPTVVQGAPSEAHLPKRLRSYVIPIVWKGYSAAVVICLKS